MARRKKDEENNEALLEDGPEEVARDGNIVTLSLPAKLTLQQRAEYGDQLGGLEVELGKLKSAKKEYLAEYRESAEPLEKQIADLSGKLDAGEELHEVKCELEYDLASNMACYRRLDTGEVVHTRAMRASELEAASQGTLPIA